MDEPIQKDTETEALLEGLPYGASLMREKKVAKAAMGTGILMMAVGASVFAVAWWFKLDGVLDAVFVVILVAWMLLIISSAFWVVATIAEKLRGKIGEKPKWWKTKNGP